MADELQTLAPGYRLGDYEVQRLLGSGTFGNVYLCHDENGSPSVAVREYMPHGLAVRAADTRVQAVSPAAEEAFRAGLGRFVRRAERMMAVEHPNLVRIRSVFEANSTSYVAMDYVAGRPLAELLGSGSTLSSTELVSRLRPVAEALATMHRNGTAHGNLGLGSIVVREDGSPVLLGLAVSAQDEFGAARMPGYAPIEHYSSRDELVSPRADAYSLAAVLYRCVTGVTPPEAPIRAERDTLVPAARAAKGRRGYDPRLLAAIDAALTLDPAKRPDGVQALLDVLVDAPPDKLGSSRRATRGEATGPDEEDRVEQAPSGRYKVVLATAVVGLAAVVAGISLMQGDEHLESELDLSAAEPTRFERELDRATGTLIVTATPPGAWIEWNGERLAEGTPATLAELPAGPVTLTLGAPGHVSAEVPVEVPKDASASVTFSLDRAFGTLTLVLSPTDADVALLDDESAYSPGVRLPEGPQRIAVSRTGWRTVERTVDVVGATRHEIALEAEWHPFTVTTNPPGALVTFVDGDEAYSPGVRLPPGEYELQATLLGYAPWVGTVRHTAAPTVHAVSLEFVSAEYADPLRSGDDGPAMTVIPAGTFRMGCVSGNACEETEQPVRAVTIATPYSMSKHEVSFEDFDRFARATGRERPDDSGWGRGRRPVIGVSWVDANDYASWLSVETGRRYRLPTEAEWEYAARAGGDTAYGWGEALASGEANCSGCGRGLDRTVPTGSFRANAWGLHDMHGNVWEWVEDCWNPNYAGAPVDGSTWAQGDCARRVLRGGSWFNPPAMARSAARLSGDATVRGNIAGFRVVVRDE